MSSARRQVLHTNSEASIAFLTRFVLNRRNVAEDSPQVKISSPNTEGY
jgi:hypothetical protein